MPLGPPAYRCLNCGAEHGREGEDGSEFWFWRIVRNGRVGPMCSQSCADAYSGSLDDTPRFTLAQHAALTTLRDRYEQEVRAMDADRGAPRFGAHIQAVYVRPDGLFVPVGPTEDAVLTLFLASPSSNAGLARRSGYKRHYIKNIMSRLIAKFGAESRTDLYRMAAESERKERASP